MQMDAVKNHFESEAPDYDGIIIKLIPYYPQMIAALLAAIPFERGAPLRVIDLGCGTGSVSLQVKKAFPQAQITCLDLAANMIAEARTRLAQYPDVRYQCADFRTYEFDGAYDLAVSSLALHHLASEAEKKTFYGKIFAALNPGGFFCNADVVLASGDDLQRVYMERWREFMRRRVADEEIEGKWMPTYYNEDRPARLLDHLAWLTQIGFQEVDVLWKYYNFAVYCGRKG